MAQILKLPIAASKLGYRRVRKPRKGEEDPNQLDFFTGGKAELIEFTGPDISTFQQALMSDERGDQRAAELYAKAIDHRDCVADAFCNLGIIETENGNFLKAFDCFTTSLKLDPRHIEAHYNLANLYFDQNDFRLAQLHFEISAELDPTFASAVFNLALVQAINGDAPAALRALSKYKSLVSPDEARVAEELLQNLQNSLAAAKKSRLGTG